MLIDVIIPVYNQLKSLNYVIEGFSKQVTRFKFNIFIVDDGSIEDIKSILDEEYSSKLTIFYYRQKNSGRSSARNNGFKKGIGDLIIFNDGDRIPGPHFIEKHALSYFSTSNSQTLTVGFPKELYTSKDKMMWEIINNDSRLAKLTTFTKSVINLYSESGYSESKIIWLTTFSGNMSLSRKLFEQYYFDENFKMWGLENIELGYRLFEDGVNFKWNKNAVNYHIAHSRPDQFYDKGVESSIKYLISKYGEKKAIVYIKSFLLGDISLQDFECLAGDIRAEWIRRVKKPVYNRIQVERK